MAVRTAVHNIPEHHEEGDEEIKESRVKIPIGDYVLSGSLTYTTQNKNHNDYKT